MDGSRDAMADFAIKGMEELNTDILEAAQHYPKEVEKHLKKTGDVLKRKPSRKPRILGPITSESLVSPGNRKSRA